MKSKKQKKQKKLMALLIAAAVVVVLAVCGFVVFVLINGGESKVQVLCPDEYQTMIETNAARFELPKAYVAAVIMAESSYRSDAVSSANAQGMMQLLPETAEWVAGKLDETYEEGCLFDAETNIRYGCWYLGWLYDRYGQDIRCASAAYHAGQGNVDKWLQNPEYSDDGVTLKVIPFDSTNTYVERIVKYYNRYEEIYAEK